MVSAGSGVGNSAVAARAGAAQAPIAAAVNHAQIAMGVARKMLALISLSLFSHCCLYFSAHACMKVDDSRTHFPIPLAVFCERPPSCDPVYVNRRKLNTATHCRVFLIRHQVYCAYECRTACFLRGHQLSRRGLHYWRNTRCAAQHDG